MALLFLVVLLVPITSVGDADSCSSGDFSCLKLLLVAGLTSVVAGGDLGPSDSLLLYSELLSPGGPVSTGVVVMVTFLC